MHDTAGCKEKLSQSLLPRRSKPFIDHNLQFQMPDETQMGRAHSPIYAHYMGEIPPISSFDTQVNLTELYQAMKDAKHSYEAWHNMKEQLSQAAKSS